MDHDTTVIQALTDEGVNPGEAGLDAPAVEQDLLVEDVSIDGMCGVY